MKLEFDDGTTVDVVLERTMFEPHDSKNGVGDVVFTARCVAISVELLKMVKARVLSRDPYRNPCRGDIFVSGRCRFEVLGFFQSGRIGVEMDGATAVVRDWDAYVFGYTLVATTIGNCSHSDVVPGRLCRDCGVTVPAPLANDPRMG